MSKLAEYIKQRMDAGILSARVIHHELTAPESVAVITEREDQKTIPQQAFEARAVALVSELVALVAPQVAPRDRLAAVAGQTLPSIIAKLDAAQSGLGPESAARVDRLKIEALALFMTREGYGVSWPPAADIGAPTRKVAVRTFTTGPAMFETLDIPRPTLDEVRELCR